MKFSPERPLTPAEVLALGGGVGMAAAGILWGLAKLLPVLFEGLVALVRGLIGAVVVGIATAEAGTTAGFIAAPWLAPVMTFGAAVTGCGAGYLVLIKLIDHAEKRNAFAAILPIISIWTGAITDLGKELFGEHLGAEKAVYSILAGGFVLASGILAGRPHRAFKIAAFLVAFMPPAMFILVMWANHTLEPAVNDLRQLHGGLGAIVFLMLMVNSAGLAIWGAVKSDN